MRALEESIAHAQTTAAMGQVAAEASQRRIGHSAFCFFRLSGPVISPSDAFALNSRVPAARVSAEVPRLLPLLDREIMPFAGAFDPQRKSFDLADIVPYEVARRTEVFNTFWRPWGVERQLVGFLGTAAAPRGFLCVARGAGESPFTPRDLEAFEQIRHVIGRALAAARPPGLDRLDDTLSVLSTATAAPWMLFDAGGELLWLTDEASARLSLGPVRIGSSVAVPSTMTLQQVRAWVRAEARRRPPARTGRPSTAHLALAGEQIAIRRFETRGGSALFLVGLAEAGSHPGAPTGDGGASRAALRAKHHACARGLTPRQVQVLAALSSGSSNKSIAGALGCSESAVEQHVTALLRRFGATARSELVAKFWSGPDVPL